MAGQNSLQVTGKTPLEKARIRAVRGGYAALAYAAICLILGIFLIFTDNAAFGMGIIVASVLIAILGAFVITIKSRVAVVLLLVFSLAGIVLELTGKSPGSSVIVVVLFIAYINGTIGCFSWHKLKKQERLAANAGHDDNPYHLAQENPASPVDRPDA